LKKGGSLVRTIPAFKEPVNTPFVTNTQRAIKGDRYQESQKLQPRKPIYKEELNPKPLVDLQVYQQATQQKPPAPTLPPLYVPATAPGVYTPPQFYGYNPGGYYHPNTQIPIIKKYDIHVGGPVTDYGNIRTIYEDILPTKDFSNTYNTLGERVNLYQYIRSVYVKNYDGENIELDGSGTNSLLSYLKFIELQPNNNLQMGNPYKGLPQNLLLWRSCYPIRHQEAANTTVCAMNSIGMNIRIYGMTNDEYNIKVNDGRNSEEFDLWRELYYYEYVRENIIKKTVSPNFILMYAYFINQDCKIDFSKFNGLRKENDGPDTKYKIIIDNNTFLIDYDDAERLQYKQDKIINPDMMNLFREIAISKYGNSNPMAFGEQMGGGVDFDVLKVGSSNEDDIDNIIRNFKDYDIISFNNLTGDKDEIKNKIYQEWMYKKGIPQYDIIITKMEYTNTHPKYAVTLYNKNKLTIKSKKILTDKLDIYLQNSKDKHTDVKYPYQIIIFNQNLVFINAFNESLSNIVKKIPDKIQKSIKDYRFIIAYETDIMISNIKIDSGIINKDASIITNDKDNDDYKLRIYDTSTIAENIIHDKSYVIVNLELKQKDEMPKYIDKDIKIGSIRHAPSFDQPLPFIGKTIDISEELKKYRNDNYSGKALVSLTEAPTHSMLSWACKTYKAEHNVYRMINTGYYKPEIWMSVLFQIFSALYVLQLHKISITELSLKDNIYIKDVKITSNVTSHWKYKIDGIDYYVPNYGYLVLIDSNYKDIDKPSGLSRRNSTSEDIRKIYAEFLLDKDDKDRDTTIKKIEDHVYDSFRRIINPNEFSVNFTNNGCNKPPDSIIHLLSRCYEYQDRAKSIKNYIFKYMRCYMNNRIGTILKESEVKNILFTERNDFKRGDILVYEFIPKTYKFVLFVEQTITDIVVLTKEFDRDKERELEIAHVSSSLIYNYSIYEPIVQNYKPSESNLSEDQLLETYIIN
jgi:hypothetical protein